MNDCFQPVSRYWDRISRPEQLIPSALQAMRVLSDPAETGAVTLALCQDVQAEAYDYPTDFFDRRVWHVRRSRPEPEALARVVDVIRSARRPLIVAGGGVIYSEATEALQRLVEATGIPVAQTQAGKGSLPYDHPSCLGAVGVSGTRGANLGARDADVVVGIGTRWTDFTTASHTLHVLVQHPTEVVEATLAYQSQSCSPILVGYVIQHSELVVGPEDRRPPFPCDLSGLLLGHSDDHGSRKDG